MRTLLSLCLILVSSVVMAADPDAKLIQHLQDVSVTINCKGGQGSGTLITRKVGDETVNFVWTAAHVVDTARTTRQIIHKGAQKTVVEFDDVSVIQEFYENGRRVGEIKMDAYVVAYSDADVGDDLALLRVRKTNYVQASAKFYLDKELPPLGTELYHCGSLLGQVGSNSLVTGIIAQQGRVLNVGKPGGTVFDQTTLTIFPGSSGGGVYRKTDGAYVGMIVRGTAGGFNFMVPIRRMKDFAKEAKVEWALDESVPMPTEAELKAIPAEVHAGVTDASLEKAVPKKKVNKATADDAIDFAF